MQRIKRTAWFGEVEYSGPLPGGWFELLTREGRFAGLARQEESMGLTLVVTAHAQHRWECFVVGKRDHSNRPGGDTYRGHWKNPEFASAAMAITEAEDEARRLGYPLVTYPDGRPE